MKILRRFLAVALTLCAAASLAAQENGRAIVFQAFGGGASHLRNLNSVGTTADFKLGFNVGGAVGVELNDYVALHGDFTWTRNEARGAATFAGTNFDRFFYGGHVELSLPNSERGVNPFLFGGGGAVTVHQAGSAAVLANFTKPAAMFGLGVRYLVPRTPVELLIEGKSLVYKWEAGGFSRTQWDLSYSAGLAYRLGF